MKLHTNKRLKLDAGLVSAANSTTLALSSGESFTGAFEFVSDFASVSVLVIIDTGSSEAGTLTMGLSTDALGTHQRAKSVEVSFGNSSVHTLSLVSKYFRVSFAADQGTSCTGYVQTIYHTYRTQGLVSFIGESINDQNDATLTRSVLTAKDVLGNYVNVQADINGGLLVGIPKSTFDEVVTTVNTPVFNASFMYDVLNTQLWETILGNSVNVDDDTNGTVTVTDSVCNLNITTDSYSYAVLRSKTLLKYFPGTTNLVRFTAVFDTPVANTIQRIGLGTAGSEFSFGYNGTAFSIYRGYGGKIHEVKYTVTAAEGAAADTYDIVLNTTTTFSVTLSNAGGDIGFTAAELANEMMLWNDGVASPNTVYFTDNWHAASIDETVIITALGVGAKSGTYTITAQGAGAMTGSFSTLTTGVALNDDYVAEASFNTNSALSQTLTKTNGNVYQIKFSWLGFNQIEYGVLDPTTGKIEPVHIIKYANTSTTPSILIPNMPFQATIASTGAHATAMTLSTVSVGMFTQSVLPRITFPRFAADNTKTVSSGSEVVVLALKCRYSINGIVTQSRMVIDRISFSTEATKNTIFRVRLNPDTYSAYSTSDYPDWQYTDENDSIALYDTAGDTFTNGTIEDERVLAGGTSGEEIFERGDLVLNRGDVLLITTEFSSGTNIDITVAASWVFDI
jgi:hypothetical protein